MYKNLLSVKPKTNEDESKTQESHKQLSKKEAKKKEMEDLDKILQEMGLANS